MVNNFSKILPLLTFRPGYFYFVQILQRKKDHNALESKVNGANNNSRLIKAYYIDSLEKFEFVRPEIITLCEVFGARAGINMNLRSWEKMAYQQLKKIADQIMNREFEKAHRAYNSVCGFMCDGYKCGDLITISGTTASDGYARYIKDGWVVKTDGMYPRHLVIRDKIRSFFRFTVSFWYLDFIRFLYHIYPPLGNIPADSRFAKIIFWPLKNSWK